MREEIFHRTLIIVVAASFVINIGFSALSPIFPYLILAIKGVLKELPELSVGMIRAHEGAVELGFLTAAFMITRAPTAGAIGFVSDVIGKKKTILLGMALYTASALGFILSNSLLLFIVFRALQGVASGMVWPVAEALLADVSPRWSRGKAISVYTSSMMIAQIFGPSLGVAVYKLYVSMKGGGDLIFALKTPIVLLALLSLSSLLTLLSLPSVGGGRVERFGEVVRRLRETPRRAARSLRVMYINGAINGFAMGIIQTVMIVYIIERVVKDPVYIGIFFSIFALLSLPTTLLAGYLSDRFRRRKPFVVFGYLIGRTVFFIIPLIRSYLILLIVGSLISLVFGLSMPAMRALQADLAMEGTRGSVFGLQQLFLNAGTFIGSIVGGYLTKIYAVKKVMILGYTLSGYIVPFWTAGILGFLTTALFIIFVEERED